MIVKMTILRLLGTSDDKEKEKIGIARPEGPPLRGFRIALRSDAPEEPTHEASVHPMFSEEPTPWQSQVSLWAPDEPTGQKGASVHWASYVSETVSRAQEKFLQHRLNRRCIGVLRRCNDVSAQEKILKHWMNR